MNSRMRMFLTRLGLMAETTDPRVQFSRHPHLLSQGGRHYEGSHAAVCPTCQVTLSHGRCKNRMCARFVGQRVSTSGVNSLDKKTRLLAQGRTAV